MEQFKKIKSFNVKMYNEKIAELDNAINVVNDYLYLCMLYDYDREAELVPDFIKEWFVDPKAIFNDILSIKNIFEVTSYPTLKIKTILRQVSDSMENIMKAMYALIMILPYVKESYGTLFTLQDDWREVWQDQLNYVIIKTKDAERLIMEQCIEWEDDYMNEEV